MINFNNKEFLKKEIYIHDYMFRGFSYDYDEKKIILKCDSLYLNEMYEIIFNNVIYVKIEACTFWGEGNSIIDFYIEKEEENIKMLYEKQKLNSDLYKNSILTKQIKFIETSLILNSGDLYTFVCEYITSKKYGF